MLDSTSSASPTTARSSLRLVVSLCLLIASTCLISGCGGFFGTTVEPHKTIAKPPSNVMVYLSVEENEDPVADLDRGSFEVHENSIPLDSKEVHLQLLPRDSVADGHTVLILDLSGDIQESDLEKMARGATHFVEKVSTSQAVTILVFDGTRNVRLAARFPKVEQATERPLPDLTPFVSGDSSRNLHGALLEAERILRVELERSQKPVRLGTVVTMARGPDLAGRASEQELLSALSESPYEHYLLAPTGQNIPAERQIGKDGRETFDSIDVLPIALMEMGMRVRNAWGRHYLLFYCSPARGGKRQLEIHVRYFDDLGTERHGAARTEFDSDGFTAGCGPVRSIIKARQRQEAEEREKAAQAAAEIEAERQRQKAVQARQRARAAAARTKQQDEQRPDTPAETGEEDVVAPPASDKYE